MERGNMRPVLGDAPRGHQLSDTILLHHHPLHPMVQSDFPRVSVSLSVLYTVMSTMFGLADLSTFQGCSERAYYP